MSNVMLMVDSENLFKLGDILYDLEEAKAEAQEYIENVKREVVEDIFNDVLGLIVDTDWYGEMIDCNDVRNLKQKYLGCK